MNTLIYNPKELKATLKRKKIIFNEQETRMNYGFIGTLSHSDKIKVQIFPHVFYIIDKEFPVNQENLKIIQSIQVHHKELEFVNLKPVLFINE